jgi:hypothetical protein
LGGLRLGPGEARRGWRSAAFGFDPRQGVAQQPFNTEAGGGAAQFR